MSRLKRVGRGLGRLLFVTSVGVAGGGALATAIPTTVPFGHSEAKATLSFDGQVTLEAGMIGSLRTDLEEATVVGPLELGATFALGEIAAPPQAPATKPMYGIRRIDEGEASFEDILEDFDTSKIQYYGEFYRAISRDQPEIQNRLRTHTLKLMALVGLGAEVGVLAWSKIDREKKLRLLKDPRLVASVLGVGLLGASVIPEGRTHQWQSAQYIFEDTELRNVEISGAPAEDLSMIAGEVIAYIEATDTFYEKVKASATSELASTELLSEKYRSDPDVHLMMLISDMHCNPGMPEVVAQVAQTLDIRTIVDAGDTVMAGTSYEKLCVNNYMSAFAHTGATVVQAPGNHDSPVTEAQLEAAGAHVLHDEVVEVNGLHFYGTRDPYTSRAGEGLVHEDSRNIADIAADLGEATCDSTQPVILVAHNNTLAKRAIEKGCATLGLYGHTHALRVVHATNSTDERSVLLNSGTAGGAAENSIVLGPIVNETIEATFMAVAVTEVEGTMRAVAFQKFSANAQGVFSADTITVL